MPDCVLLQLRNGKEVFCEMFYDLISMYWWFHSIAKCLKCSFVLCHVCCSRACCHHPLWIWTCVNVGADMSVWASEFRSPVHESHYRTTKSANIEIPCHTHRSDQGNNVSTFFSIYFTVICYFFEEIIMQFTDFKKHDSNCLPWTNLFVQNLLLTFFFQGYIKENSFWTDCGTVHKLTDLNSKVAEDSWLRLLSSSRSVCAQSQDLSIFIYHLK